MEPAPARRAGLWRRLAALAYEFVLLFGLLFIAAYLFIALTRDAQHGAVRLLFQLYLLVVCGAYFVYCWTRTGQTLPMKTWGLRVETKHGGPLTMPRAVLRYLLAIISVGSGIGVLWAVVDRDRQFLHDRLAGTRIVTALPANESNAQETKDARPMKG